MITPQQPIKAKYTLLSAGFIGEHITQIATDNAGEFAVLTNREPEYVAQDLRRIADQIENDVRNRNP